MYGVSAIAVFECAWSFPTLECSIGLQGGGNKLRQLFYEFSSSSLDTLRSIFDEYGEIIDCSIMRDPQSKRSR